jgi:hypothetical protein
MKPLLPKMQALNATQVAARRHIALIHAGGKQGDVSNNPLVAGEHHRLEAVIGLCLIRALAKRRLTAKYLSQVRLAKVTHRQFPSNQAH